MPCGAGCRRRRDATGRRPRADRGGTPPAHARLGAGKPATGPQGQRAADRRQCRTSMRDVWAIGDLAGEPMLAHRAMAGRDGGRAGGGQAPPLPAGRDPGGLLHRSGSGDGGPVAGRAEAAGLDCLVASFPFAANGRAALESTDGFVRWSRGATIPGAGLAGGRARRVGTGGGVLAVAGDGRHAGRRGRHHPRPSHAGRGGAGSGAQALGHALHICASHCPYGGTASGRPGPYSQAEPST